MSATLTNVKAIKPDMLIVSGHSNVEATAARQIDEMRLQFPIVALTHCEAAKVQEKFPAAANGFLCPTQWVETSPKKDKYFGTAAEWNADFKKAYPSYTSVPYQTAQASAAVIVWKEAFEAANSFDTSTVRDAIAATDMETFYGNIRFSDQGNNIAKPMIMRQINDSSGYDAIITPDDMVWPRKADY
jgi:branched-chain amino acid transport system substrate-binding protein